MDTPIITLTTDWGDSDFFVGMVKGRLYSEVPEVRVCDISHSQDFNELGTTALVIKKACMAFPEGSIHIVDVCDGCVSPSMPVPVVAVYHNRIFLALNPELLGMSFDEPCDKAFLLPIPSHLQSYSFLAYDVLCPVAVRLALGAQVDDVGGEPYQLRLFGGYQPQLSKDCINALVTSFDKYGNAILNVKYEDFEQCRAGRPFVVDLGTSHTHGDGDFGGVRKSLDLHYGVERSGSPIVTVSASGYLQLAINQSSLRQYFGINIRSSCLLIFK